MSPQGAEKQSSEIRVEVEGRTLKLSNLDKVLYPRTGTTKGEVLNYYAQVSPAMLPLLRDRCATRVRWPNGVEKQSFFEKNIPNGTP
jgi:bifunctional non-homologous end joining protein LigD